jgi:undecaprenyl-diphosphatase
MNRFYVSIYVLFLVLFGLLGYFAYQSSHLFGDIAISLWLREVIPSSLSPIMYAVSYIHSVIPATVIVTLLAVALWALGKKRESIFIAALASSAALINWLLKLLINRPRPSGELIELLDNSSGLSFPSGHITYAVVFYGFLFCLVPRLAKRPAITGVLRSIFILLFILTCVSRVYLGAHWPSDVLGSFFLGGLILAPTISLYYYTRLTKDRLRGNDA